MNCSLILVNLFLVMLVDGGDVKNFKTVIFILSVKLSDSPMGYGDEPGQTLILFSIIARPINRVES